MLPVQRNVDLKVLTKFTDFKIDLKCQVMLAILIHSHMNVLVWVILYL